MSAPDQKDWAMTDAEIESVQYDADLYGVESDEVQAPILAVARRRALAELKAIVARFDDLWFDGAAEAIAVIHDRIAEIEAEG